MQILIRTGLKGLSYNIFLTPVAYEVDESVWQAQQVVGVMSCPHSQVNSGCNQESTNHVDGVENSPPDHTVTVRDTGWGLNCAAVQEKLCSCGTPAAEIHLYYIMAFLCSPSAHLGCNGWLFDVTVAFLSTQSSLVLVRWPLSSTRRFLPDVFSFSTTQMFLYFALLTRQRT